MIESAIDTISAIGRDISSRETDWREDGNSEYFGIDATCWNRYSPALRKEQDHGYIPSDVAEDSRNLHSDASSFYHDNQVQDTSNEKSWQRSSSSVNSNRIEKLQIASKDEFNTIDVITANGVSSTAPKQQSIEISGSAILVRSNKEFPSSSITYGNKQKLKKLHCEDNFGRLTRTTTPEVS